MCFLSLDSDEDSDYPTSNSGHNQSSIEYRLAVEAQQQQNASQPPSSMLDRTQLPVRSIMRRRVNSAYDLAFPLPHQMAHQTVDSTFHHSSAFNHMRKSRKLNSDEKEALMYQLASRRDTGTLEAVNNFQTTPTRTSLFRMKEIAANTEIGLGGKYLIHAGAHTASPTTSTASVHSSTPKRQSNRRRTISSYQLPVASDSS